MAKKQMGESTAKKKTKPAKAVAAKAPTKKTTKSVAKKAPVKAAESKPKTKPAAAKPATRSKKDTILEISDTAVVKEVSDKVMGTLKKSEHWHTLLFALVVILAAYFSYQASTQMTVDNAAKPATDQPAVPAVSEAPQQTELEYSFPNDYAWVTQDIGNDLVLGPGESGELTITVKNTGKATWYRDGKNPFRLGTLQPENEEMPFMAASVIGEGQLREAVNHNRVEMLQKQVAPGEVANFRLSVKALDWGNKPLARGRYQITVGFLVEQKGTLSKNPLTWSVNVR